MDKIQTFKNFNNQDIIKFVRDGDIQSIKNYIDCGYDLNVMDKNGYVPIIEAARSNQIIIKLLLDNGANINKQETYTGSFALIIAALCGHISNVKILLEYGAEINANDYDGTTALICASIYDNIEIVKLLLNAGADIDKQDNQGDTALILAASNNNRETVEILLDYGADEFILNDDNKSFYDHLNGENKQYFLQKYPTSVYNAISHNYKKSFTEFIKDNNIKIKK